jgi:hypothetical protein
VGGRGWACCAGGAASWPHACQGSAARIWPLSASLAAAGVHPGSYSEQGSYRERGVVSIVSSHNAAVNGVPIVSAAAKVLKNGTWVPGQEDAP